MATFCLSSCESEADRISRISLEAELFKEQLAQEEDNRIQKQIKLEEAEKGQMKKKREPKNLQLKKRRKKKKLKPISLLLKKGQKLIG